MSASLQDVLRVKKKLFGEPTGTQHAYGDRVRTPTSFESQTDVTTPTSLPYSFSKDETPKVKLCLKIAPKCDLSETFDMFKREIFSFKQEKRSLLLENEKLKKENVEMKSTINSALIQIDLKELVIEEHKQAHQGIRSKYEKLQNDYQLLQSDYTKKHSDYMAIKSEFDNLMGVLINQNKTLIKENEFLHTCSYLKADLSSLKSIAENNSVRMYGLEKIVLDLSNSSEAYKKEINKISTNLKSVEDEILRKDQQNLIIEKMVLETDPLRRNDDPTTAPFNGFNPEEVEMLKKK